MTTQQEIMFKRMERILGEQLERLTEIRDLLKAGPVPVTDQPPKKEKNA